MNTKNITKSAVIAGLYVVLTLIFAPFSSGVIQCRVSEGLTILPIFTASAIPGLFVGCAISNLILGGAVWDVVFGSIATLLGAIGTYLFRKHKLLPYLCPIIANTLIIPFLLSFVYNSDGTYIYFTVSVLLGEAVSCGVFGVLVKTFINKNQYIKRQLER